MSKCRVLVTGRYLDNRTFVFYTSNGSPYQTIIEGGSFFVADSGRIYYPVRVKNPFGFGTIIECRYYDKYPNIGDSFYLVDGLKGYLATTAKAVRRGGAFIELKKKK